MRVITARGGLKQIIQSPSPLTTKGDLLAYSTEHIRLAVGTDGYGLKADSSQASGLAYAAFPLGAMTELSLVEVSSAVSSIAFTGLTGYASYFFLLAHLVPSANNADLRIRTSTNNGSSYDSTNGNYQSQVIQASSTTAATERRSAGYIDLFLKSSDASSDGWFGNIHLYNPAAAKYGTMTGVVAGMATAVVLDLFAGRRSAAADVDAVQFYPSSGNFASGYIAAYGLAA